MIVLTASVERLDRVIDLLLQAIAALPFDWAQMDFMGRALLALLLLAPTSALLGVFVVNFRMAFFSDAIAHSAFAGVATGFLLLAAGAAWADPRLTLVAVGLLVGMLITVARRHSDLGSDTVIGVAFSAVIALGIVIITHSPRFTADFNKYLYGDVLFLDRVDLRAALLLGVVVLVFTLWSFNRLLLLGLNADLARTRGVRNRLYDHLFAILVVILVTVTIRITGILLVTALLIVPAAAARNIARTAGSMLWLAVAVALFSAVVGLIGSYYVETAAGAAVILVGTVCFLATFALRAVTGR